jgi:hypothetical protein
VDVPDGEKLGEVRPHRGEKETFASSTSANHSRQHVGRTSIEFCLPSDHHHCSGMEIRVVEGMRPV